MKLGYAGDNIPKYVFPALVGRPALRAEEVEFGDLEVKVLPYYNKYTIIGFNGW